MSETDQIVTRNGVLHFKTAMVVQGLGLAVLSGILFLAKDIRDDVNQLAQTSSELSRNIAVIAVRLDSHENRINRLENQRMIP